MVSSSKILTVSYGTFSCTAEGFDDPLEVVKETTHFFRGVVGEDRFFGAEPPQFDPELASEYLRDRMADTGGTLTLGSPPRVMAAAASAGAMAAAMGRSPVEADTADDLLPDDDTIEATAVLTETLAPDAADLDPGAVLDDVALDGPEAAPAPPASGPDDIAAKLDRIRAVVAQTAETEEPPLASPVEEAVIAEAPVEAAPILEEPAEDIRDDALESLLEELVVESGDADAADLTDDADFDTPEEIDDTDSALDDAVARLMATDDDAEEDDAPIAALTLGAAAVAVAVTTGQARADELAQDDDETMQAEADDLSDADASIETALGRDWAAQGPLSPAPHAEEDRDEAPEPAPERPQIRARVVKVKRAAFEQAIDEGTLEEVREDAPPAAVAPSETSSLSAEEEEELARELAAVKAELASDFGTWDEEDDSAYATDVAGQAPADDDLGHHDAPLRLDNPIATPETTAASLDPDLEEDLEEELDDAMGDSARKAVKLASPARALLTEREVGDGDTSRLLDQTNTEMDEPEGNRRRSAIAHLRAAVAATKADRLLGHKADAAEEQEPYREDLASVVRPRRPQSVAHTSERPQASDAAPTPLKLVAEQRVAEVADTLQQAPEAAAPAPVRPRRVRRTEPVAPVPGDEDDASGFAAFAQDAGVTDLPELLEAAAAYMSYVEGRDQFSRPQLMTTLRQAEVSDSSREDRLRSFGQLLREGKIRKTSGGRFTAAETISFKPAANG